LPQTKLVFVVGENLLGSQLTPADRSAGWRRVEIANGDNGQFRPNNRLKEDTGQMDKITKMFVKVHEYQRGQTMAEYALILAAVAVVVFIGYETMGTTITTLLSSVDGKL
jgi:Flp pilus assembly pilin Flp